MEVECQHAGAHSVTASRRSISQQYRWAWCARPESVGYSKPATLSASVRERSDARGMDIHEKSKEAALKCDKCGLIFPDDQCCLLWKHRNNNCKHPKQASYQQGITPPPTTTELSHMKGIVSYCTI